MKDNKDLRNKNIMVPVTEDEKKYILNKSEEAGLTTAAYIRYIIMNIKKEKGETKNDL